MVADLSACVPVGASDEFMLYQFKVLPCTRKGAHSWTECAFTHPGEKAARRCPKTYIYSAEACPDARKSGKCARGDMCPYSHGVFEQWLHPSRYRTQLCSFGTACRRPVCFFAHTVQELRVPTGCGPNPTAVCANPLQAAAMAAAAQVDPAAATAAAAAAAAAQGKDGAAYAALMQQALLAQMTQATAAQQLDGPTATMINRYQAASCAALANAAAYQQQHQAAAAAAAAAAMAAAASNPASLLQMAQAAQAYQAAAAAAAAAAANIHLPSNMQGAAVAAAAASAAANGMLPVGGLNFAGLPNQLMNTSNQSSSSTVSSPTCSSNNNSSLMSASTFLTDGPSAADPAAQLPITSQAAAAGALYDELLLKQALAGGANNSGNWPSSATASPFGGLTPGACGLPATSSALVAAAAAAAAASPSSGASSFNIPWLPAASGALACGNYPSSLMPATPGISDGFQSMSAAQLTRQLSLQLGYQA